MPTPASSLKQPGKTIAAPKRPISFAGGLEDVLPASLDAASTPRGQGSLDNVSTTRPGPLEADERSPMLSTATTSAYAGSRRFTLGGDETFPLDYFQAEGGPPPTDLRHDWIAKLLELMWPKASEAVMKLCVDQVKPILQKSLEKYTMMSEVSFTKMSLGDKPPQIGHIECYRKDKQEVEGVQIDCRVQFSGPIDVQLSIGRGHMVQVGVTGAIFDGTVSMVIKPMLGEMPVVGGVQLFCLNDPMIRLKFGGILNMFAQLPVLKGLVRKALKRALRLQLVLPNRLYVKIARIVEIGHLSLATLRAPPPEGIVRIWITEVEGLPPAEHSGSTSALNVLSAAVAYPAYVVTKVGAMRHRTDLVPGTSIDPKNVQSDRSFGDYFVYNVRQHVRIKIHREQKNNRKGLLLAELLPRIDVEVALKDTSESGSWYELKVAPKSEGAPDRAGVSVRVRLRAKYFQLVRLDRVDGDDVQVSRDRECCAPVRHSVNAGSEDRSSCVLGDFDWLVAGAAKLLVPSAVPKTPRTLSRGPPDRPWLRSSNGLSLTKQLWLWRAVADSEGLPNLMLAVKFLSGVGKLTRGFPGFTSKDLEQCRFIATMEDTQLRSRSAHVQVGMDHGAVAGTGGAEEDAESGRFDFVTLSWNSAHYLFVKDPVEAHLKLELHPAPDVESNGVIEFQAIPVLSHVDALDRPFRGTIALQQVPGKAGSTPKWCADLSLEMEWQLRTAEVADLTHADSSTSARTDDRRQYWV